jgi:CBS domain-containing protein
VRAGVTFDFRHVGGGLGLVSPLTRVVRSAKDHPNFLGRLARTVTDWPVPLKRLGGLKTDDNGQLDLKKGGTLPIVNLARFYAVSAGITVSGTRERLVAAEETGSLDPLQAISLREAFAIVFRARIDHHAACLRDGRTPDNLVRPQELPPLQRATLQEALHEVAGQQKRLSSYAPLGI